MHHDESGVLLVCSWGFNARIPPLQNNRPSKLLGVPFNATFEKMVEYIEYLKNLQLICSISQFICSDSSRSIDRQHWSTRVDLLRSKSRRHRISTDDFPIGFDCLLPQYAGRGHRLVDPMGAMRILS